VQKMLIANSPHDHEVSLLVNDADCNTIAHGLYEASRVLAEGGQWDRNYVREMELLAAAFNGLYYALQTAPDDGEPDGLPTLASKNADEASQ
jgi:hypothetical protein